VTGTAWAAEGATAGPGQTRALAAALAVLARPGDLVLLAGGLGAGKTTFAQGFARGLGVEGPVTSPTFTLVRQYPCPPTGAVRQMVHADVYRLDSLGQVADLALPELLDGDAVALVEWGDAAAPVLGEDALTVTLEPGAGDDDRTVRVAGRGARWSDRREAVAAAVTAAAVAGATGAAGAVTVAGDGSGPGGGR
jgi:tRNA threonylcarbamoyladenosine biosynthesis protein TsaE